MTMHQIITLRQIWTVVEYIEKFDDRWDKDHHPMIMHQILTLRQTWIVVEYIENFDDLRPQILLHNPSASEVFFVSPFIEGLKEDIYVVIALHCSADIDIACSLATL